MRYYVSDETKGRRWGLAAAAAYLLLWALLMIFVRFGIQDISTEGEGIMVNFGDMEQAGGEADTQLTDDMSQAQTTPAPSRTAETAPSEHGDVETPQPKPKPKPKPETPPAQEPPRQADPRALFPGRTASSSSTSEGRSTGTGNQGNPAGQPDGSHEGTGTGTSGSSFNLAGRSPVGALPKPEYNSSKQGRVVVDITVNPAGEVVSASYRATGSIGVDNVMIEDALRAARKARFTVTAGDNPQTGTITYIFRMN